MRGIFVFIAAVLSVKIAGAASFALDYRVADMIGPRRLAKSVAISAQGGDRDDGALRRVEIPAVRTPVIDGEIAVGDMLDVVFFDGCSVSLTVLEREPSVDESAVFIATADGYDGQAVATVVQLEGRVNIDVQDFKAGRVYSVLASSERTVVREIDASDLPCECEVLSKSSGIAVAAGSTPVPRQEVKSASQVYALQNGSESATVDILVVYDTYAADWAKSQGGGIRAFAEVQVQKMNVVLASTDLDRHFRFRLVGVYEVGGSAGGDVFAALEAAQSGTIELNGVVWDGVHAKRDEVGADIVCVLVDNGLAYGTTGVSYSLEKDSYCFSEYAYNASLIRAVANGQTMTHEVGHNMGAGHATAMADVDRGPQYFNYSAGYYLTDADGGAYHTVMAYSDDGYGNHYTPIPYFSSPAHTYKSVPVGDQDHDNTSTLRQTFPMTVQYREAMVYTVAFGKNGGTGGADSTTVVHGQPMPTPRTAPNLPGWTFSGYWDTVALDADGNPLGKQYYDGNMNSVRAWDKKRDATLWAKWTKKVTLGKNGGTGGDNYVTVICGQPMPTPRTSPTLKGWTFGGYWSTVRADAEGNPLGKQYYGANMQSVRSCGPGAPETLWAKWNVRVNLGKNGGAGGDNYVTVTMNQPFPQRTMPRKPGSSFAGYWISSVNMIGQCYDPDGAGTESMRWSTGGNPTIWALWTD